MCNRCDLCRLEIDADQGSLRRLSYGDIQLCRPCRDANADGFNAADETVILRLLAEHDVPAPQRLPNGRLPCR